MSSIFSACDCSIHHLGRVERSAWMRVFPWMRLYQCANCRKLQLLPQKGVDRAKATYGSRATYGKGGRDATPPTTAPRA
ncbi:hypothetical protein [Variovorax sp. DAIF25]|jgi:hypothetical protein|uniref:hypothetical protein n=1 Tax=Variovorax sp. DAIF25 TaxID=3080983 RepID=UPI003D6B6E78